MSVWMEEGEAVQQSRLLLNKSFMSPLPKQVEEEENPLFSHRAQAWRGGIQVGRVFMKLLTAGGKCLLVYMELQSPGVAGAPICHLAGSVRINNLGCNLH